MPKNKSGTYICMISITREQNDWLKANGYKPSHLAQDAIDMARGMPNPLLDKCIEGLFKKLKEDGVC